MAGKGDRMRRVNGPKYRDNYDNIKWEIDEGKTNRGQDRPQSSQTQIQVPKQNPNEHAEVIG